jgi:hypothetical protein
MSTEFAIVETTHPGVSQVPVKRGFSIRAARPEDSATIANLVHELAVYEKLEKVEDSP